jgi:hypothetical protein
LWWGKNHTQPAQSVNLIHRKVEFDGRRTSLRLEPSICGKSGADRGVDDRHEEAERLARSSAGRHHETLPPHGFGNRLCPVAVKPDGIPVDAKDARRVGVKGAVGSEIGDRGATKASGAKPAIFSLGSMAGSLKASTRLI